jgi:hypothetical protein
MELDFGHVGENVPAIGGDLGALGAGRIGR